MRARNFQQYLERRLEEKEIAEVEELAAIVRRNSAMMNYYIDFHGRWHFFDRNDELRVCDCKNCKIIGMKN